LLKSSVFGFREDRRALSGCRSFDDHDKARGR
jgi:hypothetical protein